MNDEVRCVQFIVHRFYFIVFPQFVADARGLFGSLILVLITTRSGFFSDSLLSSRIAGMALVLPHCSWAIRVSVSPSLIVYQFSVDAG